ncbi:MAG: HupE/UreJ family protein [Maribacter sp.]|nr:HupE/UreJ family protein [Maribacter sp.]
MDNFGFYVQLGLHHVLNLGAYDHLLFLSALAVPFTFKSWRKVLLLATVFTIAHCSSLFLAVYDVVAMNIGLVEFLIPVTIVLTAIFNLTYLKTKQADRNLLWQVLATSFFGLIHGFGFSNYFKMLVAGEVEKATPLLGFAAGIEISQVLIVLSILMLTFLFLSVFRIKHEILVKLASYLIILITIPLLFATFPW